MTQLFRLAVVALAVTAILALGAPAVCGAQEKQAQPEKRIVVQPAATTRLPAVPGYSALNMPHMRKQLELLPKQIKQLEELGKKYYEQMRGYSQQDWSKVREMSQEERKKFYAEWQEKRNKQTQHFQAEIKKILAPHQVKLLEEYNLRTRGMSMLYNPRMLDQLEATEKQKKEFTKIRQEMQQKMQQLRDESFDKMLKVLTKEQRKKLQEMSTQGYRSIYGGGGGVRSQ